MLLRLSRWSAWLAAGLALFAFFGPTLQRASAADLALGLAAIAFLLWRAALLQRQSEARVEEADAPAPAVLGAASLHDAAALVGERAAAAVGFESALHGVADALRGELGARSVRVYLVDRSAEGAALHEIVAARPGFRAPARPVCGTATVLARAVDAARPVLDLPRALALPVLSAGAVVAALELIEIEMTIDAAGLGPLLDRVQEALDAKVAAAVPARCAAGRFATAGASAW